MKLKNISKRSKTKDNKLYNSVCINKSEIQSKTWKIE